MDRVSLIFQFPYKWLTCFHRSVFSQNRDDEYQIQLDSGLHPCRFPKNSLERYSDYFNHLFLTTKPSADKPIEVPGIRREAFDLAIQWACCKQFTINASQCNSTTEEITAILNMVLGAEALDIELGLHESPDHNILTKLKELLIESRKGFEGGLQPAHIRMVWLDMNATSPIRRLFAKFLVPSWFEFRYPLHHIDTEDEDDDEDDPFGRYTGDNYLFRQVMKEIPEFRLAIYDAFERFWWNREINTTGPRNRTTSKTKLRDPLTGDEIRIPQ